MCKRRCTHVLLSALVPVLTVLAPGLTTPALVTAALLAPPQIQQISSDPYTNPTSQHETEVEPATFAFGSTIVSAFQAGRRTPDAGLGASNIGWARSTDGGATWTHGFLPSLTVYSSPPGTAAAATDPSVAYDRTHGVWLLASNLVESSTSTPIAVSRSTDGLNWSAPVTVATGHYDKDWIACDNGPASPFQGHCYVAWDDAASGRLLTSTSIDGGLHWGSSVASADNATGVGVQPVVQQPSGTVVIVAFNQAASNMIAIRSTDGGAHFGPAVPVSLPQPTGGHVTPPLRTSQAGERYAAVAGVTSHPPTGMRAGRLPAVSADAAGRIYAVWQDCRFRPGCPANDIVMSTSTDGSAWSPVRRIPIDPVDSGVDHFIPGLAVDPTTAGGQAKLVLTYYSFPVASCTVDTCQLNVAIIFSTDGGETWHSQTRLNAQAMSLSWIADTTLGRMVGDYAQPALVNGTAVAVFALATAPSDTTFHEAMYASRMEVPTLRSTMLTYTGETTADYHDPATLAATLVDASVSPPAPICNPTLIKQKLPVRLSRNMNKNLLLT